MDEMPQVDQRPRLLRERPPGWRGEEGPPYKPGDFIMVRATPPDAREQVYVRHVVTHCVLDEDSGHPLWSTWGVPDEGSGQKTEALMALLEAATIHAVDLENMWEDDPGRRPEGRTSATDLVAALNNFHAAGGHKVDWRPRQSNREEG